MNPLIRLFNLHEGEDDKLRTLDNVKNNITFRGANLWILACAIMVNSIGLNVNSTAVIIGAMLISPLMGPIVGSGFALGVYDFDLLKKSLRNLLTATIVGLLVSSAYFYISPFKEVQSEMLARTSPNIYDVLIAFFGGLVGGIAATRVEKINPIIPGVAIATALMPPLCTAGYGIATGNLKFFSGALFLYAINCVFICIATFVIVKYLKYPAKKIDIRHEKRVKYGITTIIVLMLLPSAFFAYSLYNEQKFKQSVNTFLEQEFSKKGATLIYRKSNYNTSPKTIEIAFLRKHFSPDEIRLMNKNLGDYGLADTKLIIMQDSTYNISRIKDDILNEIKINTTTLNDKDTVIKILESEIAKNNFNNKQLSKEARAVFPGLKSIAVANHFFYIKNDSTLVVTVLIYDADKQLGKRDNLKLADWLKERLSLSNVEVYKK